VPAATDETVTCLVWVLVWVLEWVLVWLIAFPSPHGPPTVSRHLPLGFRAAPDHALSWLLPVIFLRLLL
jgi:hypothetical protein